MSSLKSVNNPGILLCTDNYLRIGAEQIGGIERISVILINLLRKTGCRFFNAFKKTDDGSGPDDLDDHNFSPCERIWVLNETSIDDVTKFVLVNNITVIHLQQAESRDFLFYHLVATRTGCRLIYSMLEKPLGDLYRYRLSYNLDALIRVPWKNKWQILIRLLTSGTRSQIRHGQLQKKAVQSFKYCDKIILQSELYIPALEKLLQRQVSDRKLTVLPNCVSYPDFFAEENIPHLKQREALVIGNLNEESSKLSVIINIWKQLHKTFGNWTLRILGDGQDFGFYKKIINKNDGIILEGRQEPILYYQSASIFLTACTSAKSFCSPLLDAMQNALVPVILDTSEIYSDIIENEVSGFIVSDMIQMERTLEKLMSDRILCQKIARKALSRAKLHGQLIYARKYYDLYHS